VKITKISNGLQLFIQDKYFQNEQRVSFSHSYNSLTMQFNLKGSNHNTNFLNNEINKANEKHTVINLSNKFNGYIHTPKNTYRQVVSLILDKEFLLNILPEQKQSDKILNFFETNQISQKLNNDKMKFKTQTLAYEIFNSPYTNNLDKLYIESKAFELIHHELTNLLKEQTSKNIVKFSKQDKEAIYYAREILLNNLSKPPSMKELARKVAINELKLKVGFNKFFGQTPYNISLEYRLQEAKKLLHSSDMNITEIAQHVGYKYATNFSKAFLKRFGIAPKELMKTREYYY